MKYNNRELGIIKKALCIDCKSDSDLNRKSRIIYKELFRKWF